VYRKSVISTIPLNRQNAPNVLFFVLILARLCTAQGSKPLLDWEYVQLKSLYHYLPHVSENPSYTSCYILRGVEGSYICIGAQEHVGRIHVMDSFKKGVTVSILPSLI